VDCGNEQVPEVAGIHLLQAAWREGGREGGWREG
jgi:hypothetical protein